MLELHQLRIFVVVAEERHFTRAATRLGVAQPAVSQQIRKLERQVGQPLFERNARSVRLTRAGEVLLPHAQATLRAAEVGLAEVAAVTGKLQGSLRVGVVEAVGPLHVPELLAEFRRQQPDVTFTVQQSGSQDLLDHLRQGSVDVAFLSFGETSTPPGTAVRWRPSSERIVVVLPPGHPLSPRDELRLPEIANEPFVTLREGTGHRAMVDRAFTDLGIRPHIVCDVSVLADILDLVVQGMGICMLPESVATNASDRVTAVPLTAPVLWRHLGMAWRSPETIGKLTRAFITFAEPHIATP